MFVTAGPRDPVPSLASKYTRHTHGTHTYIHVGKHSHILNLKIKKKIHLLRGVLWNWEHLLGETYHTKFLYLPYLRL